MKLLQLVPAAFYNQSSKIIPFVEYVKSGGEAVPETAPI